LKKQFFLKFLGKKYINYNKKILNFFFFFKKKKKKTLPQPAIHLSAIT